MTLINIFTLSVWLFCVLFALVVLRCANCELFCAFRRQTPKLGMAKVTQVDFPPREIVSYTKETQTPVMTQQKEGDSLIKAAQLATVSFAKPAPMTETECC